MHTLSDLKEINRYVAVFSSMISKCEKVLNSLSDGCWQKRWTEKQLDAYDVSIELLRDFKQSFPLERIREAIDTLEQVINRITKAAKTLREASSQSTLAIRRMEALEFARGLMIQKIDGTIE